MALFVDTLIEFCEVRSKFVHLERTQRACARAERCEQPMRCPLMRYFRRDRPLETRVRAFELGYE
jgi:hypothetical protein